MPSTGLMCIHLCLEQGVEYPNNGNTAADDKDKFTMQRRINQLTDELNYLRGSRSGGSGDDTDHAHTLKELSERIRALSEENEDLREMNGYPSPAGDGIVCVL